MGAHDTKETGYIDKEEFKQIFVWNNNIFRDIVGLNVQYFCEINTNE